MAGTLPPLFEITSDDHAGYVAVASYTLLALTVVVVATRLSARWFIGRIIYPDDILLAVATLLAVVQTITVQLTMQNGLGRRLVNLQEGQLVQFQKYRYVAQILLVVTMAFSKLSLGLLFRNLMSSSRFAHANWAVMGVVVAWALGSSFALIFRCDLPTPWKWLDQEHCVNQRMLFQAIGALNIITDVAIAVLPCLLLRKVKLSYLKRLRMMALLSSRVFVCLATVFQIRHSTRVLQAHDPVWKSTKCTIWDQVVMNLSIITTAIPSLGRLVIELQPNNFAFPINDEPRGAHSLDNKQSSSIVRSSFNRDFTMSRGVNRTSIHGSTRWRDTIAEDDESMDQLFGEQFPNHGIQQKIEFDVEVH